MTSVNRIKTEWNVEAMVALDTFDLLTARVRTLLSFGRRISMTRRYTWLDSPPDLFAGLTIDTSALGGGINEGSSNGGKHFAVLLRPRLEGFGFSAYAADANSVEAQVWKNFHAKKATSDNFFDRRRDMTLINIVGGLAGSGPGRDDLIIIHAWNGDGVCDERVIAFDCGGAA